jgi:hypothetical protein
MASDLVGSSSGVGTGSIHFSQKPSASIKLQELEIVEFDGFE